GWSAATIAGSSSTIRMRMSGILHGSLLHQRQANGYAGATVVEHRAVNRDRPAERLDETPGDVEPEPAAFAVGPLAAAVEPLEHPRLFRRSDPGAAVDDLEKAGLAVGGEPHEHRAPGGAVDDGILEQVEDRLLEHHRAGRDDGG